jgi:hypothetical protein
MNVSPGPTLSFTVTFSNEPNRLLYLITIIASSALFNNSINGGWIFVNSSLVLYTAIQFSVQIA